MQNSILAAKIGYTAKVPQKFAPTDRENAIIHLILYGKCVCVLVQIINSLFVRRLNGEVTFIIH